MPEPNGGNGGKDGSGGTNSTVIAQQQQLLRDIQVTQFAVNPATVQPFQATTVTVSYQVQPPPTALEGPVSFSINGQKLGTNLSGSATFPGVTTDTTFSLLASTRLTDVDIATTEVTIDQSQCRQGSIQPFVITQAIKVPIDTALAGHLSGNGSTVTLSDDGLITIKIPLYLAHSGIVGDTSINITVEIAVEQSGQSVSVTDQPVTVQVIMNTQLDVGNFCTDVIQGIVQAFMQHIVDAEIVPAIGDPNNPSSIAAYINSVIKTAEQSDPSAHVRPDHVCLDVQRGLILGVPIESLSGQRPEAPCPAVAFKNTHALSD